MSHHIDLLLCISCQKKETNKCHTRSNISHSSIYWTTPGSILDRQSLHYKLQHIPGYTDQTYTNMSRKASNDNQSILYGLDALQVLTDGLSLIRLHTAIQSSRYVNELCVLRYKCEIWHKCRAHNDKNIWIQGHLRCRLGRRWRPFSKMTAVNLFSHIFATASSKSVVLVSNIGFRGPLFQIYNI